MKRSGLVLSGSDDEPLSSDKAGVLFAQEIAELDLSAVDLVVLSACQTAGGEIHEDGVFGLQRGFKQAGVGTIVMTLWPVNSAMTQSFMTSMYGFLAQGYDTREAFYNARTEVRKHYKKASDWGAFIILD
jgi:CHAT domain-containing protein